MRTISWSKAKEIAGKITEEEINQMVTNAKNGITDWTKPSRTNKGMSWGTAWNIMVAPFFKTRPFKQFDTIYKLQLIRLFGEWLPDHLKPLEKLKIKSKKPPTHFEPDFTNW